MMYKVDCGTALVPILIMGHSMFHPILPPSLPPSISTFWVGQPLAQGMYCWKVLSKDPTKF